MTPILASPSRHAGLSLLILLLSAIGHLAAPATPAHANGCPPERPGDEYLCPDPTETSHADIEYIYSNRALDWVAIKLTDAGMDKARTCDGATEIAGMVILLYERIPRRERARDAVDWAASPLAIEIHAHAKLGQRTSLLPVANPVDIDFRHYEGDFPQTLAGLEKRGEQLLFKSLWSCS